MFKTFVTLLIAGTAVCCIAVTGRKTAVRAYVELKESGDGHKVS